MLTRRQRGLLATRTTKVRTITKSVCTLINNSTIVKSNNLNRRPHRKDMLNLNVTTITATIIRTIAKNFRKGVMNGIISQKQGIKIHTRNFKTIKTIGRQITHPGNTFFKQRGMMGHTVTAGRNIMTRLINVTQIINTGRISNTLNQTRNFIRRHGRLIHRRLTVCVHNGTVTVITKINRDRRLPKRHLDCSALLDQGGLGVNETGVTPLRQSRNFNCEKRQKRPHRLDRQLRKRLNLNQINTPTSSGRRRGTGGPGGPAADRGCFLTA